MAKYTVLVWKSISARHSYLMTACFLSIRGFSVRDGRRGWKQNSPGQWREIWPRLQHLVPHTHDAAGMPTSLSRSFVEDSSLSSDFWNDTERFVWSGTWPLFPLPCCTVFSPIGQLTPWPLGVSNAAVQVEGVALLRFWKFKPSTKPDKHGNVSRNLWIDNSLLVINRTRWLQFLKNINNSELSELVLKGFTTIRTVMYVIIYLFIFSRPPIMSFDLITTEVFKSKWCDVCRLVRTLAWWSWMGWSMSSVERTRSRSWWQLSSLTLTSIRGRCRQAWPWFAR